MNLETEGVGHGGDTLEVARLVFVAELLLGRLLLLEDAVALCSFALHTEHICLVFLPEAPQESAPKHIYQYLKKKKPRVPPRKSQTSVPSIFPIKSVNRGLFALSLECVPGALA